MGGGDMHLLELYDYFCHSNAEPRTVKSDNFCDRL